MLGQGVVSAVLRVLVLAGSAAALLPEDLDAGTLPGSLQEECASRCEVLDFNQNRTDDASSEVGCGVRCKIDQCTKGCAAWQEALETSCQAVCNGTQELLPPKELYCVLGCHDALNRYFQQLKVEIGTPPAPALVADSLTPTSLSLEWNAVERRGSGLSYLVQWRYEELVETWQYCRNQTWGEDNQILVENLQPYTKYRFRVALLLKSSQHNPEPIVSAPSVVIPTLAEGLPTSAPVIVRAAAVDSCRVSVSWEPGPFPNGPLLSYVLRVHGNNSQLKDIPASENTDHYMFQNLEPNKNYTVSVTMRNGVGEGPSAVVYISTTPEPAVKDMEQKTILILGGEHTVMKQGADMLDEPSLVYRTESRIRGVAIHVASAQLFVSDSEGYVYRMPVMEPSDRMVVLNPSQANFKPLSLSVDWLNLHLYVLGEVKHATTVWQIARCNLDGRGLTVAMAGILTKPLHVEVDPYNGYLFWVTQVGLHRLDLVDISNGVKHEVQPDLIVEDSNLGAFTVDHTNFRLLVPHHIRNTVMSVSLDGREIIDLRQNTQQPKFQNVVSLAMANGLFYWTNGEEVLTEGYHSPQKRYFHNAYPDRSDGSFVSVNVLMNASQPVPVPVNPPTGVQAVLGAERAKVSWQAPHLLGGQGKGAWQNWSYKLEIKDESTGEAIRQNAIDGASHTVDHLRERSEYSIKAAAYTSAGIGPWSTEFRGRTLRDPRDGSYASILWSASEGLLRSNVTGENVDTLIHRASLRDSESEYHIVDASWYEDVLYLVGNNSVLYLYNTTSHQKSKLNINSVGSVAVDWISKKLYWANPKQQIITRANLNGSQPEPMSILAIVKELMIDSLEAYLYWSTGHAVEVARLNGQDRRYYHSDEIFNGKQVMGLTLDTEKKSVYWIVRSYESGSILYRAPTSERIPISQKINPIKVSALQHSNMQGPLCYFSEHLLWLQDDRNAVIGDLSGQNTAVINGITLSGLHMVAIMDPALHQYPKNLTSQDIVVLPDAVDNIRVEGTWRKFNVSWNPVKNINYGTVFYEVKFADYINTNSNPKVTTETSVPYNNSEQILPYSVLDVTVKAFTYWESSHHTRKILRSPQSVPSEPVNARSFVEILKDPLSEKINVIVIFRWDPPEFTNGVIGSYTVQCWDTSSHADTKTCNGANVTATSLEYEAKNLHPDTTYHFQVQAHTEVGPGPYTDVLEVSTGSENPVPQILIATTDDVRISDLDRRINDSITKQIAVELAYSAFEKKIYWINEMRELVKADLNGANAVKMLTLNDTASSLCVDWVSRSLFWTELGYKRRGSHIMRMDLTAWEAGYKMVDKIVTSQMIIVNLDISPSTGSIYWIETTGNESGVIMQSDLYGKNVQPFFNHTQYCSCPDKPSVRPVMAVDNTDSHKPSIYWVSLDNSLNIADIGGCGCNLVISSAVGPNRGLPPTSLTVDKVNIYWSKMDEDRVYSVDKKGYTDESDIKVFHLQSARSIKAIGKSLQPYPGFACLLPQHTLYDVEEISKTAVSITVKLPKPAPLSGCKYHSLPATLYTINVSQCLGNDPNQCASNEGTGLQTYERKIEVKNLNPFTRYKFKLALSNYYSNFTSLSLEFGPGVILRTGAGAPSPPEKVTVQVLTPTMAAVNWMPPKILNAATVRYEVHWRSVNLINGERKKGEQLIQDTGRSADGKLSAKLQLQSSGQEYMVYVRAYPDQSNDTYNQSAGQLVTMYPEPNNLTLTGVDFNKLNVSWTPSVNLTVNYVLEYTGLHGQEEWIAAEKPRKVKEKVKYTIENLQPKALYKFRLRLRYPNYEQDFIWPSDARFKYETRGAAPSTPGIPKKNQVGKYVYEIRWGDAQANGSPVTLYRLEGRVIDESNDRENNRNQSDKWTLHYNGTNTNWIIPPELVQKYQFRVQAKNECGFGAWSEVSEIVDLTTSAAEGMLATRQHLGLLLGLIVPAVLGITCCGFFLCPVYRQRKEDKKAVLPPALPDVELATLREIPRGNFVQSNALYASAIQNDQDDSTLPKIRREQITLAKFLGSGAFGEVFQGNAKDLDGAEMTRVAIKTLRKGASAQEKTEFLQEARLMSHFQHKHVLRLLGVCLDTDPPLLVLELMEAGDLLSYLRASRPLQPSDPRALRLQDLLAMCEDVARGCRYLEELHFVHRDLACRNCLVSARNREDRVVKIGDFGLARDIYKNDYYRKEGEGLLPVRWMAPESLVDGVFTSQSDVWAFGVLMWEITSLGQQPYPARTNLEVLHHVRAGGRLPKSLNCPPALHQLMLRCWSSADARPSFKTCLEHIVALRSNTEDATLSPVHAGQYLARRGVSNMAYFADENQNHNDSGNSWKSSSSEGSRDMQPFLPDSPNATTLHSAGEIPKYLQLLADNEEPENRENPIGGYEVPRPVQVLDQGLSRVDESSSQITDQRENIIPGTVEAQNDSSTADRERKEKKPSQKRASVTSLNLPERKRASITSIGVKCNTMDNLRTVQQVGESILKMDLQSSLGERRKCENEAIEKRGSETSLGGTSCSSRGSCASLAPSTRPSSSLINSQNTLPLRNNSVSNRGSLVNEANATKNTLAKLQGTHSLLRNGKAFIPLVINNALLYSVRQTPGANEDGNEIATYTNVNKGSVRANRIEKAMFK